VSDYVKTGRHPQNRKYVTYCTVVTGGPSHGHSWYRKFREVWTCGFWDMRADRQTHWWQFFTPLPGQSKNKCKAYAVLNKAKIKWSIDLTVL